MPLPDPEPPLSRADLMYLQHSLARQRARAGARVPLTVAVLGVCGADAEGALLLAVCPLPDPEVVAEEGVQRLSITLEGGQTVALTIALSNGHKGEAPAYVIQLAYQDEDHCPPDEGGPR
jgi:hypothetical protein